MTGNGFAPDSVSQHAVARILRPAAVPGRWIGKKRRGVGQAGRGGGQVAPARIQE